MTHSFDKEYWDGVWQGDRAAAMAAGEPNPHLVRESRDLTPGSALDAGCGAGAEAIWLAARGWRVTAADISTDALDRAVERAAASGMAEKVRWVAADLSTWQPDERYDLVTTHYAHPAMPQLDFYERAGSWVAPGGTLLVVGHLAHRDGPAGASLGPRHERHGDDGPPDEASATASAITSRLHPPEWTIATARESHRSVTGPGGHEVTLRDVVVRATRRS